MFTFLLFAPLPPALATLGSAVRGCCYGMHYTIGLPAFSAPPYMTFDPSSNAWSGFVPDYFDEIASEMGFTYKFTEYTVTNTLETLDVGRADFVITPQTQFREGSYGAATAQQAKYIQTAPFSTSTYVGVSFKKRAGSNMYAFVDPFTPAVWAATAAVGIGFALCLSVLSSLSDIQPILPSLRRTLHPSELLNAVYHAFAMLLDGEEYPWQPGPARLLRLGMLSFVMIMIATYTANLAAIFSAQSDKVYGPSGLSELRASIACDPSLIQDATTGARQYTADIHPFVSQVVGITDQADVISGLDGCHTLLRRNANGDDGAPEVMLADKAIATSFVLRRCDSGDAEFADGIEFGSITYVGMLPSSSPALARNLTIAFDVMLRHPRYEELRAKYFSIGKSCDEPSADSEQVGFDAMAGLFISIAAIALASLLLAYLQRRAALSSSVLVASVVGRHDNDVDLKRNMPISHTMTQDDILRELLAGMRVLRSPTAMAAVIKEEEAAAVMLQSVVRGSMERRRARADKGGDLHQEDAQHQKGINARVKSVT